MSVAGYNNLDAGLFCGKTGGIVQVQPVRLRIGSGGVGERGAETLWRHDTQVHLQTAFENDGGLRLARPDYLGDTGKAVKCFMTGAESEAAATTSRSPIVSRRRRKLPAGSNSRIAAHFRK